MNRIFTVLLIVLLSVGIAGAEGKIYKKTVFNQTMNNTNVESGDISDGTAYDYSEVVNLDLLRSEGYFAIQVYLQDDDGTVTLEWEVSLDNNNFTEPLDENGNRISNICTDFAYNHGKGTDGREYFTVPVPLAKFVRLKISPTAADDDITNLTIIFGIK